MISSQVRWESTGPSVESTSSTSSTSKASIDDVLLMRKQQMAQGGVSKVQRMAGEKRAGTQHQQHQQQQQWAAETQRAPASTGILTPAEERQLGAMRIAQAEIKEQLQGVLRQFDAPIRYAFAYGSGVYKQAGYSGQSKPMIDLVFAVSHPDHWHALNIAQNRSHYSFMGSLGADAVTFVQSQMGAGVYYNPFVEINGVVIKYGVVSMDTLSSDLLNWDSLYLAGRMHKPTLTLRRDPLMRISKQVNLTHAMRAALLMLPKNFSSRELFHAIASLSFSGDFRMRVGGENPNKVGNIVDAQLPLFKSRYASIIEGLPNLEFIGQDLLQQDMGPSARAAMVRKMPNRFYAGLVRQGKKAGVRLPPGFGAEVVNTEKLVAVDQIADIAKKAVEGIVARPALTQSLKGVLSSGVAKSLTYMRAKNEKSKQA
ncbi:Mitochondrial translocator assembly and maintenance protein 41 [Linderina pennispora]|nr:Mitochondrial translocator assembly and maintenance protein 41 [Linderina pennispora]